VVHEFGTFDSVDPTVVALAAPSCAVDRASGKTIPITRIGGRALAVPAHDGPTDKEKNDVCGSPWPSVRADRRHLTSGIWLQQRPGEASADAAYAHGPRAYLAEIHGQHRRAVALYREIVGG
jgi:hypothetical protein